MKSKDTKRRPVMVIFLTVFIDLIGFGLIIPLSPYLAREFGATPLQVGLLMAIYSALQFLCAPLWGRLSDRIGRRPILLVSIAGTGLSHLLFYFAPSLAWLFIARGLAGLFAANISTAMAYVADVTSEKERSKSMGLIGAAFGLGFICGPALGGLLTRFGEQTPALGAAAISFVNLILAFFILRESLPLERRRQNGLAPGQAPASSRPSRLNNIIAKVRRPVVGAILFAQFAVTFAMANMEASLFLYMRDRFAWTVETASYGFAYVGVWIAFTQGVLVRSYLPKWGERKMLLLGLILFTGALAGVGLSQSVGELAVGMTLLAIGNGFINPALTGSLSLLTPSTEQGEVIGVNHSMAALARILGPPLGGFLYAAVSMTSPFYAAALVAAIGTLAIVKVREKIPTTAKS